MSVEFDFSELTELSADLGNASGNVAPFLHQALEVTSRNVKDDWNANLYTSGHAKLTGHAIDYDIDKDLTGGLNPFEGSAGPKSMVAVIGAKRGRGKQAGVVRLLENGSVNNAPHGAGSGALKKNEDDFQTGVNKAIGDALGEVGL